jgi:N6-L-threonylcarbamoyladenine synthase
MLGLPFPAGAELEKMALNGASPKKIKPVLKGSNCCLSGVENQCKKMLQSGENMNNIARYAIEFISDTLEKMTDMVLSRYGNLPLIFAGGVMSNSFIRKKFTEKYNAFFAEPRFSSDNAVGVAILAHLKNKK